MLQHVRVLAQFVQQHARASWPHQHAPTTPAGLPACSWWTRRCPERSSSSSSRQRLAREACWGSQCHRRRWGKQGQW